MYLPIEKFKDIIVKAVISKAFTIISGETGSGKSTQVPKYLSEVFDQVIVTEPRIMAAKTLAMRVSEEMGLTLGNEVGYNTAYDKCYSQNSKILFCTDGLQLVRTIFGSNNQESRVLIIDEVHEWNLNMEVLIAWCKFMYQKWNTKVVIMSATMDTQDLATYFGEDTAVVEVPGTLYDVKFETKSKDELISTIKAKALELKNVLVFVPGKKEISDTIKKLKDEGLDQLCNIFSLHGEMGWEDQKKCFESYSKSKIIVSTNVAQTSLTIPDIDVVVDTGLAKITKVIDGIQGLYLVDISNADIKQRMGRAGRTKSGEYYLCSNASMEFRYEYPVPEIQRSILDRVILQLADIGLDAENLEFYHQPSIDKIMSAKKELFTLGATNSDNTVTEIGHKMVKIPVSVQASRMIIEAEKYGVTEQVIIIAAILEMGSLLGKRHSESGEEITAEYSDFTDEGKSDLLAELDVWNYLAKLGYVDFDKYCINKQVFFKVKEHIKRLHEAVSNIVEISNGTDRMAILKSCLHGLVSHIYYESYRGVSNKNEGIKYINKKSCFKSIPYAYLLIGIPQTIQYVNRRFGGLSEMNIVKFGSVVPVEMVEELLPGSVQKEEELSYDEYEDAVRIEIEYIFDNRTIKTEYHYEHEHPEYSRLKDEYEAVHSYSSYIKRRQDHLKFDGKEYEVFYSFDSIPYIYLDVDTIFTTTENTAYLKNGTQVQFSCFMDKGFTINELKNSLIRKSFSSSIDLEKRHYSNINITGVRSILDSKELLGKVEIKVYEEYGVEPRILFGCICLKKNTVHFALVEDEKAASENTSEAFQFLFMKEIEQKYGNNKFSHLPGKKKKVLTPAEQDAKLEFDSLVRELLPDLTVDNYSETMEFLDVCYQEAMEKTA